MIWPVITLTIFCFIRSCNGEDAKIIGGKPVEQPNKYPWLVSMQVNNIHACAGTIWNKYWIVTAAHCIHSVKKDGLDQVKWVTAPHKLSQPDAVWSQTVTSVAIIIHPTWDYEAALGDIAMVKVDPAIIFNVKVAPGNFINYDFNNVSSVNFTATVAGWGTTSADMPNRASSDPKAEGGLSDDLKELETPVITLESCQRYLSFFTQPDGRNFSAMFTEDHLCAGSEEGGSGPCFGDSGGPLMVYDNATLLWTQLGLVSWGPSCAGKRHPTVFTRTARYYRWMVQVTRSCVARSTPDNP